MLLRDGSDDVARAVAALSERLPVELASLARLAYNLWWSWSKGGPDLFREIDALRWERCDHNPVRLLQEAPAERLRRAAADAQLVARAKRLEELLVQELRQPPVESTAFLCAEYALHRCLPIYSGGLGAIAGDLLKEASDCGVPMVAVGLFYRQGYFHQRLDASGWQHEYWVESDLDRLPAVRVLNEDGSALRIAVSLRKERVLADIWRVDVGRVPLFLLDTDIPANSRIARFMSARLYVGDRQLRLAQYALLGIGGVRALRALGIRPRAVHLNEGHAALAAVELVREAMAEGRSFDEALAHAQSMIVFTTHTPVAAGNEAYGAAEIVEWLGTELASVGAERVLGLGRIHPTDSNEPFGLTPFSIRASRSTNAVSARHGEVARAMWQPIDATITHVTNGVHLPTWMAGAMRELLGKHLGAGWETRAADADLWAAIDAVPDEELWAVRQELRASLVEYVRDRSVRDRLARSDPLDYVEAAAETFDPGVLTVVFARRLATYKRLHLLSKDPARVLALLQSTNPIQVLIAGKAHPRDDEAKRIVQAQLFPLRGQRLVGQRVAYLEDYDMGMALALVQGADVWINLPRSPLEASGTSGMKAALNGSLNLSVLDGWWAEAYDGENGFAIPGDVQYDAAAQDARDAALLYDLIEREVAPLFYDRDASGLPRRWLSRIKHSLRTIGPRFITRRTLAEYASRIYAVQDEARESLLGG